MRVFVSIDGPILDIGRFEDCNRLYAPRYDEIVKTLMRWGPVLEAKSSLKTLGSHEIWLVIPSFCALGLVEAVSSWCQVFFPEYNDRILCTPDYSAIGTPSDVLIARTRSNFPGTTLEFSKDFGWTACIRFIQACGDPASVKHGNIQDHVRTQVRRVERGEIGLQEFFDEIKRGADLREIIARLVKP